MTSIVVLFLLGLGYCLFCLVKPQRKCGRCGGTRRSQRFAGVAGPTGKCRKCRGGGRHSRFGARAVHWFIWSAVVEPLRERREHRHSDAAPKFAEAPRPSRSSRQLAAARLRAQQRADRLLAFQARLRVRTAATSWQFA